LVDTQRSWPDSNAFVPGMVSIGGLRWYKNRTVFNYYPDSKCVHNISKELRQSLLTMVFLTSGRIDLATSFTLFTPEIVHDFSRIYPVYREPKTARPLDAFTGVQNPQVYDLELTKDWHQVALFNTQKNKATISVKLCGDRMTNAIGLDPNSAYYAYDFWNDKLIGKRAGPETIEMELAPMNCAMVSIRKVQSNPQVISTNRHVLQGWVELSNIKWDPASRELSGRTSIVGGEPMKIVISANGFHALSASAAEASAELLAHPSGEDCRILMLTRKENGVSVWSVKYQ